MRSSRRQITCILFAVSLGAVGPGVLGDGWAETRAECLRSAQSRLIACYETCHGSESESECRRSCKEYYAQQVQSCADKPRTQELEVSTSRYSPASRKRSAAGKRAAQASSLCTAPGMRTYKKSTPSR